MKKFPVIVCGGTFDLLHAGHREFLRQIFEKGERVVIGLTSDKYISENKAGKNISSFDSRKQLLEEFLKENGAEGRVQIISIDNMYGPLLDPKFQIDAIAVTPHSKNNANKINSGREKLGLNVLKIVEIVLVKDESGEVISSSRLRENLLLPSTLRYLLQDAWGEILQTVPTNLDPNKVITVGDVTTGKFIEKGIFPKLLIIDNKVERKDKIFSQKIPSKYSLIKVKNPVGEITKKLSLAIKKALRVSNVAIIVDGEEDLAVLPALLYAPIGFEVYYGQPHVGLVCIRVTNEIKNKAAELVDRFEVV